MANVTDRLVSELEVEVAPKGRGLEGLEDVHKMIMRVLRANLELVRQRMKAAELTSDEVAALKARERHISTQMKAQVALFDQKQESFKKRLVKETDMLIVHFAAFPPPSIAERMVAMRRNAAAIVSAEEPRLLAPEEAEKREAVFIDHYFKKDPWSYMHQTEMRDHPDFYLAHRVVWTSDQSMSQQLAESYVELTQVSVNALDVLRSRTGRKAGIYAPYFIRRMRFAWREMMSAAYDAWRLSATSLPEEALHSEKVGTQFALVPRADTVASVVIELVLPQTVIEKVPEYARSFEDISIGPVTVIRYPAVPMYTILAQATVEFVTKDRPLFEQLVIIASPFTQLEEIKALPPAISDPILHAGNELLAFVRAFARAMGVAYEWRDQHTYIDQL